MKIQEIMTTDVTTATPDMTVEEIATLMRDEDTGAIPVVDEDDKLVGIVTDRDIVVRCIAEGEDPSDCTAEDIASENPQSIAPEKDVREAVKLMSEHQIRRLPVVKGGRLVGMLSLGDISVKGAEEAAGDALEDISQGVRDSGEEGGRKTSAGSASRAMKSSSKEDASAKKKGGANEERIGHLVQREDEGEEIDLNEEPAEDQDGRIARLSGADRAERIEAPMRSSVKGMKSSGNRSRNAEPAKTGQASKNTRATRGDVDDRLSLESDDRPGITTHSGAEEKSRNRRVVAMRDEARSASRQPGTKKAGAAAEARAVKTRIDQERQTGASRSGVKTADFSKGGKKKKAS